MNRNHRYVRFGAVAVALVAASLGWSQNNVKAESANSQAMAESAGLFRENKGQWDGRADYLSQNPGLDYWVTKSGLVLDFYKYETRYKTGFDHKEFVGRDKSDSPLANRSRIGHVVGVDFVRANKVTRPVSFGAIGHQTDYMLGDKRATGVRTYKEAAVQGIYDGIDIRHYRDGGQIRYDLIVRPGADPKQIRLKFSGAEAFVVGNGTDLNVTTSLGTIRFADLVTYQPVGNSRRFVKSEFKRVGANEVSIQVGDYDPRLPLVIDPLVYGSYVGSNAGGAVPPDEFVNAVAVDKQGNLYLVGVTSSPYFPINAGAYNRYNPEGVDAFFNKMDADAYSVSYSCVLGGSGTDQGLGVGYNDALKQLWVAGTTSSANFGGADNAYGGGAGRCWVGRFDTTTPTPVPVFTHYVNEPGVVNGANVHYGAFRTSNDGNVYLAGDGPNAALIAAGFVNVLGTSVVGRTGFVIQLDQNGVVGFKNMVGGQVACFMSGMAVAPDGSIGVTGTIDMVGTEDTSTAVNPTFVTTPGVYPADPGLFQGGRWLQNNDVFVVQMDPLGGLKYSCTLGGAGDDVGVALNYDQFGNAYMASLSDSFNFQRTRNAFDQLVNGKVMVTKLSADASVLLYSTGLRDVGAVYPTAVAIDNRGVAAVGGVVSFVNNANPFDPCSYVDTTPGAVYQTPDALTLTINKEPEGLEETVNAANGPQNSGDFPATQDGFITFVNPSGTDILYSDWIGGAAEEQVTDVAVDETGSTWVGGFYLQAWSRGLFPTTPRFPKNLSSDPIAPYITGNAFKVTAPIGRAINPPQGQDQCPVTPVPGIPEFATSNGWIVKLRVQLPIVSSIILNPSAVAGGNGATSTATVNLRDPAPIGGVNLTVTLENASATSFDPFPGTITKVVTVPGGQTSVDVTIYTMPVTVQTTSEVRAILENDFVAARLTISPWLNDFSVSPASVVGGNTVTAHVVLFQPAPAGGIEIPITTDRPDLVVLNPPSITVPAGATTANAILDTNGVDSTQVTQLTANYLGVVKQVQVTITKAVLSSLQFVPSRINRFDNSIGTLRLNGKSGVARNVTISYVSGPVGAKINNIPLPVVVQVPAQSNSVVMTLTAPDVATTGILTVKADDGGPVVFGTITIDPIDIASVDASPGTDVIGGTILDCRVVLTRPAGPNGILVNVSNSNANAGTLSTNQVLIPAGQVISPFFQFQTAIRNTDQNTNIHATKTGFSDKYVSIHVRAVKLTMTVNPTTVTGGIQNSVGTLNLSSEAPAGGLSIDLTSSDTTAATVPATIVIPEGAKVKNFTVLTRKVPSTKKVTITAQAVPGVGTTAQLTVNPPKITGLSFNPSTIGLKQQTKGTITFETGVAANTVVTLSALPIGVLSMPSSVTVTSGISAVSFYAKSNLIAKDTDVTVKATLGTSFATAVVQVRVPSVNSLTFSPTRVVGGSNSKGTVTLDGPAPPGGVQVTVTSANTAYARVVGSGVITVLAGAKSASFIVETSQVSRTVAVQFSATSPFGTTSGYLYIDP